MDELVSRINALYDRTMFEDERILGGGNHNLGYWEPGIENPDQASHRLYRKVFELIPESERNAGNILEVACGLGGCARYLSSRLGAGKITGINISDVQLAACRANAPGCTFVRMSATDLAFPDASFHHVISIEAAFHFDPRTRFLAEAHRVLRPGGWLVMSDILADAGGYRGWVGEAPGIIPAANIFEGEWDQRVDAYTDLFQDAGFVDVDVEEVTASCTDSAVRYFKRFAAIDGKIRAFVNRMETERNWTPYVLVRARKASSHPPSGADPSEAEKT